MKRTSLFFIAIGLFILCAALLFYPDNDSPRVVKFLIVGQIMFVLSLALFYIGRRLDFERRDRKLFMIVLILAVLARVVMLTGAGEKFYFSDDVYRYVWDGKLSTHGFNPYLHSPRAPETAHLRDSIIHPKINHPWLPTIYPPMAQYIFITAYSLAGDATWGIRLIGVLSELLTILALLLLLRQLKVGRSHILLWLFSPLVLIEFYMSVHLDILAMPFLVAALIAMNDKRAGAAGMLLALASLVKFYGLFFAPFMFLQLKGQRWRFTGAFLMVIVASYLPFAVDGEFAFLGSLLQYLKTWQFFASLFFVFKYALDLSWARQLAAGLFAAWILYLMVARLNVWQRMARAFGGYIVLTTTLFPWYFIWMYPFLLRNLSPAFLYLSGSVLLSYHVHIGWYERAEWSPMIWPGLIAYVPFYVLLIVSAVRAKGRTE